MNLIQFLMHRATWEKLPVMPRHYSTEYKAKGMDQDTATLMKLSHIRSQHPPAICCPVAARRQRHAL